MQEHYLNAVRYPQGNRTNRTREDRSQHIVIVLRSTSTTINATSLSTAIFVERGRCGTRHVIDHSIGSHQNDKRLSLLPQTSYNSGCSYSITDGQRKRTRYFGVAKYHHHRFPSHSAQAQGCHKAEDALPKANSPRTQVAADPTEVC
jgi:hypothetical protein